MVPRGLFCFSKNLIINPELCRSLTIDDFYWWPSTKLFFVFIIGIISLFQFKLWKSQCAILIKKPKKGNKFISIPLLWGKNDYETVTLKFRGNEFVVMNSKGISSSKEKEGSKDNKIIHKGGGGGRAKMATPMLQFCFAIVRHKKICSWSTINILPLVYTYFIICLRNKKSYHWKQSHFCVKRLVLIGIQLIL